MDSDDSDASISTVKSIHDFDGKLDKLHSAYIKKAHGLRRQFSQMKETTHL